MKRLVARFRFANRSRTVVPALALVLIVAGLASVIADRNPAVMASVQSQTPPRIEIYLEAGVTQVADSIAFGTLAVDTFGNVLNQSAFPVWIKNTDAIQIRLALEDDFPQPSHNRLRLEEAIRHGALALNNALGIWDQSGIDQNVAGGVAYSELSVDVKVAFKDAAISHVLPNWIARAGGPNSEAAL